MGAHHFFSTQICFEIAVQWTRYKLRDLWARIVPIEHNVLTPSSTPTLRERIVTRIFIYLHFLNRVVSQQHSTILACCCFQEAPRGGDSTVCKQLECPRLTVRCYALASNCTTRLNRFEFPSTTCNLHS